MKITVSQMKIRNANIYFMSEIDDVDLVSFLMAEMKRKNVMPADITKRTGLSASQVPKILNRESPAGKKALKCFAQALNLPIDLLYRKAKILPDMNKEDETVSELKHIYFTLNHDGQENLIEYARWQLQLQEGKGDGKRQSSDVRRPKAQ